jgi:ribonuclease R
MEIEIAVRKYEVPHRFSPETLAQSAALPDKIRSADCKHRIDLTDVPLVTIDGEDARDFDDAVYCEPAKVGRGKGWRLIVAIADVSHYVKPDEPIDEDAYERATSVYFPRRVIPMLPEKLSNGLCSLNPNEDRLAMVCDMLVTAGGDIHAYQFYPAVMRSQARFTYTEVAAILANTRGPEAARRQERVADLLNLNEVYRALLKARAKRGAVDFETTETQIVCDENGRIEKIVPRVRTEAHKLIEETMLAANVCAADFIALHKHPGLYRVHEGPTPEKKTLLQGYLKQLGIGLAVSDDPSPAEFQAIADATKDRPDALQIHTMLLRSMQQAIYTASNSGHFGLAYEAYTHFTSPIRRYPDLLVHRVIKALLHGKRYHLATGPARGCSGRAPRRQAREDRHRRGRAVGSRRRALQHKRAPRRRGFARRRGVAQVPLHARAPGRGVRGHRHRGHELRPVRHARRAVRRGPGAHHRARRRVLPLRRGRAGAARRAHRRALHVGARVRVQVSRVDLDGRKIDFRMVRDNAEEAALLRARRNRLVGPANRGGRAGRGQGDRPRREGAPRARAQRRRQGVHPARKPSARKAASRRAGAETARRPRRASRYRCAASASTRSAARSTGTPQRSAAAPWLYAASHATRRACSASVAAGRCAHSPPSQPASTSPVPAVASAALPVPLMRGTRSGAATMLPEPFSSTTHLKSSAIACAVPSGRPAPGAHRCRSAGPPPADAA